MHKFRITNSIRIRGHLESIEHAAGLGLSAEILQSSNGSFSTGMTKAPKAQAFEQFD